MKAEIAERWVAKLRSGTIEQSYTALGRGDGTRCCLGVLCDIAVEDGIIPPPTSINGGGTMLQYGSLEDRIVERVAGGYLPTAVQEWAGMRTQAGHIGAAYGRGGPERITYGENSYRSLTDANDSHQMSFNQIADAIVIYKELL